MTRKKTQLLEVIKNFIKWTRSNILLFVVFITGACVLVLEVSATRILSPYFGNTIFTVSSVISVVLAALSFGYYFGGKLADENPREEVFYSLIGLGGISVLVMQVFINFLLPVFAYNISIITGPLITSIILFSLPSYLLGILSPFAIKLTQIKNKKKGIGKISGEIFFASTFGSIFGSIFTGFYLIPNYGLNIISLFVGATLILLGSVGRILSKKKANLILLLSLPLFLVNLIKQKTPENVYFVRDGVYSKNIVYDGEFLGKPTRFLVQDRSLSSAKYLESNELAFEYTKYYQLYKLFDVKPERALFIGGGAYITPQELSKELPEIEIEVTEIEPILIDLAKKYFNFNEKQNIKNHIADGRRYLANSDKSYDIIFSDVYSSIYSIPSHFTTEEFFDLAKSKLNENGLFIANIIGSLSRQNPSFLLSEFNTFNKIFPNSFLFTVVSSSQIDKQNTIFLGINTTSDIDLNSLINKSDDPFVKQLGVKLVNMDRFNLSNYSTFTDNYSPSDYYNAELLKDEFENYNVFNSGEAFSLIEQQVSYGERYPETEGHEKLLKMIVSETGIRADEVINQSFMKEDIKLTNVIARINPKKNIRIVLGTHYDTKKGVPGANDGASGTAILLEVLRVLSINKNNLNLGVDLVFFDGEEGLENLDWQPYGSIFFADNLDDFYLDNKPEAAIIIDMVCDRKLKIYKEYYSNRESEYLLNEFWERASRLYPKYFQDEIKYAIEDDHIAFNKVGVPSILIIDFDYDYFHTNDDTIDKCSKNSLEVIGNTLLKFIYSYNRK